MRRPLAAVAAVLGTIILVLPACGTFMDANSTHAISAIPEHPDLPKFKGPRIYGGTRWHIERFQVGVNTIGCDILPSFALDTLLSPIMAIVELVRWLAADEEPAPNPAGPGASR